MLVGLGGLILPFLSSGIPLAWLGLLLFAFGTALKGFLSPLQLSCLFCFIYDCFDFFAGEYRASKWGIIRITAGSLLGIFVLDYGASFWVRFWAQYWF
jgi:uncharacterized protein YqgC (DUF456 family)